jgi:hypothetical protein
MHSSNLFYILKFLALVYACYNLVRAAYLFSIIINKWIEVFKKR